MSYENGHNKPLSLGITAHSLPISATLAINELIEKKNLKQDELIHMGFGESLLPLHPLLKTALTDAATYTRYGPVRGILELRQTIAAYLSRTRNITCTSAQVVVGPGSKALIYALLRLLEGDVLLPSPSWVSYAPIARLGGKQLIPVQTDLDDHHTLSVEMLSETVFQAKKNGANPRILIINNPDNPTGGMFDEEDVKAIAQWARAEGITLISDEIYAELAHGWRKHVSPFHYYPEGTILLAGLSKTFSAGGWRLGYAILPATETGEKVINAIRALGSEVWSTTASPIQKAAVAAYSPNKSIDKYISSSSTVFGYVTNQLYETFIQLGVLCPRPAGGFYLYPDFSPWRSVLQKRGVKTSKDLSNYLLDEWKIAALPGSAFNEDPSALRLRLSTSMLCEPKHSGSGEAREKALWKILDQAPKKKFAKSFPLLTITKKRWIHVIEDLDKDRQ
jgi:aspartate aminotransferase